MTRPGDTRDDGDDRDSRDDEQRTERRRVEARDPSLSPAANRILTDELRQVTGGGEVEVPADRPRAGGERHGGRPGLLVGMAQNRIALGLTFAVAVVVGAILSLATGSWWILPIPIAVHALGTFVVFGLLMQMTTETEHLSPTAAARLEDEGVADPDAVFGELVEEFAPEGKDARVGDGERGTAEALSNEHDERETPAHEDPAEAAVEQKSAMTPSQDRSRPVGPG